MSLGDFSGRDLLFARPEERLSLVSLGSRSGCSEPPLSLSSEWAPLPQAPPWSAPRQGSGPGSPPFGVRRWCAERGGGEPLIGGTEPSGVLRCLRHGSLHPSGSPPPLRKRCESSTVSTSRGASRAAASRAPRRRSRWALGAVVRHTITRSRKAGVVAGASSSTRSATSRSESSRRAIRLAR